MGRQDIPVHGSEAERRSIVIEFDGSHDDLPTALITMQEDRTESTPIDAGSLVDALDELRRRSIDQERLLMATAVGTMTTIRSAIPEDEMYWWERNLINRRIVELVGTDEESIHEWRYAGWDDVYPSGDPPEFELLEPLEVDEEWLEIRACWPEPPGIDRFYRAWSDLIAFFAPYETDKGWAVVLVRNIDSTVRRTDDFVRAVGKFRAACETCADLNWALGRRPGSEWHPIRLR